MSRAARNSSLETRTARLRLKVRRTPYFAKIAQGLRLGYYRGSIAGSWVASRYRGDKAYDTEAIGIADDTLNADGATILDYWQAQEHAKRWAELQRLIADGVISGGPYTVENAVRDYLAEISAEKKPSLVKDATTKFQCADLARPRLNRSRKTDHRSPKPVAQQNSDPTQTSTL